MVWETSLFRCLIPLIHHFYCHYRRRFISRYLYLLTFRRYVIRRLRGTIILRRYNGVNRRPIIWERGDVAHVYRRHPLHPVGAGCVVRIRFLVAGTTTLSSRTRRRGVGARRTARVMLWRIRKAQRLVRHRWKARCYATHIT